MTINIIMHCRDGIVFGCDSLGSMVQTFLEPNTGLQITDPATGKPMLHPTTGKPIIDINTMRRQNVVVNSLGYENKLFCIRDYPVGILTSGIGMLDKRCIDDLIKDYSFQLPNYDQIKDEFELEKMANSIKDYIAELYQKNFPSLPETKAGPPLELLMGGYSKANYFGEIYQLKFPQNELKRLNSNENPYTLSLAGQYDAIERFLNGVEERTLKNIVNIMLNQTLGFIRKMEHHTRTHVLNELKKKNIIIDEKEISPTPSLETEIKLPFQLAVYTIPMHLFSIQNAVDFVTFLIYIVYGRQRFVVGIPSVGGNIRIAYINKHEGFRDLTAKKIDVSIFKL